MDIWDFLSNDQAKWAPGRSRPRVRWSLPSGRNPLKNHRFWAPRRPGVAPLRDPVPKILHFFWKGFRTRACTDIICILAQERFFLQRQKSVFKSSYGVRGMGPPQGPAFACTVTILNKTKKQKLKKHTQVLFRTVITIKHFAFSQRAPKCFIVITVLNETCVFF